MTLAVGPSLVAASLSLLYGFCCDARKLAELLYLDKLHPIYHGEHGLRTLKELVRSYLTLTKDHGRVMTRVKAICRSWSIPCTGKQVYPIQN